MLELDNNVLERVGSGPVTIGATQFGLGVEEIDQGLDGGGVGGVGNECCWRALGGDCVGHTNLHGFGVGCVFAHGAAHKRVFAHLNRGQKLFAGRAAHCAAHRRNDDKGQMETVERGDVGRAMLVVAALQAFVVDVEAVRVLHHKLAGTHQPSAWTGFVAVLGLDLINVQRQVFVAAVQVFDQQGEHLFVRRREQKVVAAAIFETKQIVAVFGPAIADFERLAGEHRWEMHFLEARSVHFFANDALNVAIHDPAQRQPGVSAWCGTADIATADQEAMARHLGVHWVLAQCP